MRNRTNIFFFIFFILKFIFFPSFSISIKTLTPTQSLTINQTLVSPGEVFELGFFTPNSSPEKWYIGIWYKKIPDRTHVWVANRDNPVTNSPILKITNQTLLILDQNSTNPVWFSNQTKQTPNPNSIVVAELQDNGNLVLRQQNDENPDNYLWQSFDHPTDTLLPDMKLGLDHNKTTILTSWKNSDDPSTGDFTFNLEPRGFPEMFILSQEIVKWRTGGWNGIGFSGFPEMKPLPYIHFHFIDDPDKVLYYADLIDKKVYSRLLLDPTGILRRYTWIEDSQIWNQFWYVPKDSCDTYNSCGPYGVCNSNVASSFVCNCIRGFDPKDKRAWALRDGTGGCVRRTNLSCLGDKFYKLRNMKLPQSATSMVRREMSTKDCEQFCLRNCSCTAYANADKNGTGCVTWSGDIIDMKQFSDGSDDLFVRLAASDIGDGKSSTGLIIGIVIGVAILLLGLIAFFLWKRKKLRNKSIPESQRRDEHRSRERSRDFLMNEVVTKNKEEYGGDTKSDDLDLPLFDFHIIEIATDNFSVENKLGEGGFGSVYKGTLVEGKVIAVKRLAKNSGQGSEEFKNEVRLIAKLQHRNLVRLLGCCIEINEKLLVYEYMENRGLDSILFDKARSSILTWQKRFNIICGVARGLLYLHQDSRFRIIHRDLKAGNVLLDGEMNPKISDFGMARIFGGNQIEANTRRVVGTYGYMAPEYAMDGLFSIKSDAFSFGVLVLEIVSGNKNRGFYHENKELNLLGHTWGLWNEGKGGEILDTRVGDSYPPHEVLRCIQVGLLCVQERAEDRPTMASVVLMLSSENAMMSQPKVPGFSFRKTRLETDSSSSKHDDSVNRVTVTMLDPR